MKRKLARERQLQNEERQKEIIWKGIGSISGSHGGLHDSVTGGGLYDHTAGDGTEGGKWENHL